MSYDLGAFAAALMGDPVLALIVVLTLGATVVKGLPTPPTPSPPWWARRL